MEGPNKADALSLHIEWLSGRSIRDAISRPIGIFIFCLSKIELLRDVADGGAGGLG
jgi:hypothetical protein